MRLHLTMGAGVERGFLIALLDVARHIRTHADRSARMHRMTWGQWMILRRLEGQPDLSQNELSAIAGIAPITVARLVGHIEALGLVKRHADPKDARVWRLRMTQAAAPALRDSKRCQAELDGLITRGVESTALDAMVIGLRKITENLSSSRRLAKTSHEAHPNVRA
jgi:MarR family transcriptional regulator, transcriptional regulator for hemolysin